MKEGYIRASEVKEGDSIASTFNLVYRVVKVQDIGGDKLQFTLKGVPRTVKGKVIPGLDWYPIVSTGVMMCKVVPEEVTA